jgi:sugar-specific transcriptional regulator TrmB
MTERSVGRTEVITGAEAINIAALDFFSNAKIEVDVCTPILGPAPSDSPPATQRLAEAYFDLKKRGAKLRILAEINKGNLATCKLLINNVEIRHLEGIKGNFAVSESEYMSSPNTELSQPITEVIYSNSPLLVQHNHFLFETLWAKGVPAEQRVLEIEQGIIPSTLKVIQDSAKIQSLFVELVKQAKNEILLLLPTAVAFHRQEKIGTIDSAKEAAKGGIQVSILTPVDPLIQEKFPIFESPSEATKEGKSIVITSIPEATAAGTVSVLIVDRSASLVTELKDPLNPNFIDAVGGVVFSTSGPTVAANIRFFERVKDEVKLLEKEELSRKRAELIQDILTHDIRNYNQVSRLNAELLAARLEDGQSKEFVADILKSD